MTTPAPTHPVLSLSAGSVVWPTDHDFDQARGTWNLAIDQHPSAVVFPGSTDDVAICVGFAREHGQRIAAQGTGHNAGPLGPAPRTPFW